MAAASVTLPSSPPSSSASSPSDTTSASHSCGATADANRHQCARHQHLAAPAPRGRGACRPGRQRPTAEPRAGSLALAGHTWACTREQAQCRPKRSSLRGRSSSGPCRRAARPQQLRHAPHGPPRGRHRGPRPAPAPRQPCTSFVPKVLFWGPIGGYLCRVSRGYIHDETGRYERGHTARGLPMMPLGGSWRRSKRFTSTAPPKSEVKDAIVNRPPSGLAGY